MAFICPMCDREQLVKGILRTQGLINALTGHPGTQLTGKATNQELTCVDVWNEDAPRLVET